MPTLPDLVTQAQLTAYLDSHPGDPGVGLTAGQLANLPGLAAAASRAVRRYCNRDFSRWAYDEVYTLPAGATSFPLRQFPVSSVDRVSGTPAAVLTVAQSDGVTNQRATVAVASAGDPDSGFTATGLTLTRWASGVAVGLSVPFAGNPTLAALAASINGLGAGWVATPARGFELYAPADFRPVQGAQPAMGAAGPAGLEQHSVDLAYRLRGPSGVVDLAGGGSSSSSGDGDPWGRRFGPAPGSEADELPDGYGGPGGLRVAYTAGFAVVPADVAFLTAQAAHAGLWHFLTDPTLKSETDGVLSWTGRDHHYFLTDEVRAGLSSWVSHR